MIFVGDYCHSKLIFQIRCQWGSRSFVIKNKPVIFYGPPQVPFITRCTYKYFIRVLSFIYSNLSSNYNYLFIQNHYHDGTAIMILIILLDHLFILRSDVLGCKYTYLKRFVSLVELLDQEKLFIDCCVLVLTIRENCLPGLSSFTKV